VTGFRAVPEANFVDIIGIIRNKMPRGKTEKAAYNSYPFCFSNIGLI
jgi:hypothetical protein